ncbi:MAG: ABC transporter substrate-binding protein [Thermomicrobiales bacterium]
MRDGTDRRQSSRERRVGRRAFLRAAAGGAFLVGAARCGGDDDDAAGDGTPVPEPTDALGLTPTPTQGVIGTPVAGYADPEKWLGRTLTVAVWGGDYQQAQEEAFIEPFEGDTGATIQLKTADTGRMKGQVDSGEVTWDLLTVPTEEVLTLSRENYLEPIDYHVVDDTALFEDITLQHGVGTAYFSTVLIYSAGTTRAPSDWTNFWDVPPLVEGEDIPLEGTRSLWRGPAGNLEFALLADGVALESLYPLDVERAFSSLDRIRNHVLFWYEDRKQPVELVANAQVGMASAWNARLTQLQLIEEVRINWYGGMLSADCWIIPRGAPNPDVAMDFINYATRAVPMANFARLVPYGPVNKEAFNYLRPDRLPVLPSAPQNRAVQFIQDRNWWADNMEALRERFDEWLLDESELEGTLATRTDG